MARKNDRAYYPGVGASKVKRRAIKERAARLAALKPAIGLSGKMLEPGAEDYKRQLEAIATTLSEEEMPDFSALGASDNA